MAIAVIPQTSPVVRAVSTDTKTGATALVPGRPTGTIDGDLLIAVQNIKGTGTSASMTGPVDGTWQILNTAAGSATFGWLTVFWKIANGEPSTGYSFPKDADGVITVLAVKNYDWRDGFQFDVTATFATQAAGTSHVAPTITTLHNNTLMISAFCEQTTGGTHTTPGGMTEVSDITVAASTNQSVDWENRATAGATGTRTSTVPNSAGMTVSLAISPTPQVVSDNYVTSLQIPWSGLDQSLLVLAISANDQDATGSLDCYVSSVTDDAHNIWQSAQADFVTPLSSDPNVGVRTSIWYCEGARAVRGVTATMSQIVDAMGIEIIEATGMLGNLCLDVSASGHNNNTAGVSAAVTTLNAADLIIAVSAVGDSAVTFAHTADTWTALTSIDQVSPLDANDSLRMRVDYKILAAAAAQTTAYTCSPNGAQSWTIAAFKGGAFTTTNPNPNWPQVTQEAGFGNNPNDPTSVVTWTDLVTRVTNFTTRRGKDYELARTEAGEADVHCYNVDGALDPSNGSSVYSPNVKVFTPYRMRATWSGFDYSVIQGFVERWPQKWEDQRSEVRMQVVDAMATLAATRLAGTLGAEILADGPWAYWPLDDGPLASKAANKSTTSSDPLVSSTSTNLGGDGNFGATLTLQSEDSTCWQQIRTTTLLTDAPNAIYGTCLNANMTLPQLASGVLMECWAKVNLTTPTQVYTLLCLKGSVAPDSLKRIVNLYIDTASGLPQVDVSDSAGTMQTFPAGLSGFADGGFHHYVVHTTSTTVKLWVDGNLAINGVLTSVPAATINYIEVGGQVDSWANQNIAVGLFAHVAIFQLATADDRRILRRANAGLTGFPELTGNRVSRLLNYAGWSAGRSIDPGLSFLGSAATIANQTILQALQDVASWDNGNVFVDQTGNFRFMDRNTIFNQVTKWTFGDGTGEFPYTTSVEIDYDPQYIYNDVTITQTTSNFQTGIATSAGNSAHQRDNASILSYFYRFLDKTTGVSSLSQCVNEALWWLDNYAQPHMRLATITITPSANPLLWPVALGTEIGDRVTVKRRPMGSPNTISLDCYVEQIAHKVDAADLSWETTFSLSPVRQSTYAGQTNWILNTSQLNVDTIVG